MIVKYAPTIHKITAWILFILGWGFLATLSIGLLIAFGIICFEINIAIGLIYGFLLLLIILYIVSNLTKLDKDDW
jgi:hypothetical protein